MLLWKATKKNCWMSQQGTKKSIFRFLFQICFGIMTTMFLQNTISRLTFFRIESCDSWALVCYFGGLRKKNNCWMSQQGTKKSIFRVLFRIGCGIMTTMFLKNTISRSNLFQIESFYSWVCYFGKLRKKIVECRSKEQRRAFSDFSFKFALALWQQCFCKIPFPD